MGKGYLKLFAHFNEPPSRIQLILFQNSAYFKMTHFQLHMTYYPVEFWIYSQQYSIICKAGIYKKKKTDFLQKKKTKN